MTGASYQMWLTLPEDEMHEWEDTRLVCRHCGLSLQQLQAARADSMDPDGGRRCAVRVGAKESSWMAGATIYRSPERCPGECVLAIVGSRILKDRRDANEIIEAEFNRHSPRWFVSGGAPGIDTMAEDAANTRGYQKRKTIHLPLKRTWAEYQKRDRLIAGDSECLVSIEGRQSRTHGSAWTANEAIRLGRRVTRYVI